MLTEARRRNPNIIGYGLPWSFPRWIEAPLSPQQINYTLTWLKGAIDVWGINVKYIGIWNERLWNVDYVKNLRTAMDEAGYEKVSIVLPDGHWPNAATLKSDPQFAKAVGVVGVHYPVGSTSPAELRALNITLWSSEDSSSFDDEQGGGCWARILNWNYVVGEMTSTIFWNVLTSFMEGTHWWRDSIMDASKPWSGHYAVRSPVWASAHTTQFTEPGWLYLRNGSGSGFLPGGGSYVTLVSDEIASDYTIVIETTTRAHSMCIRRNPSWNWSVAELQTVTFSLENYKLQQVSSLQLWETRLFGEEVFFFEKRSPVPIVNGSFQITLVPDSIYTLTTTTGQQKGEFPSPPSPEPFPVPYTESFENYRVGHMPKYISDQVGSFAVQPRLGGPGQAFQQMVEELPISWGGDATHNHESKQPLSVLGDWNSTNCAIAAEVAITGQAVPIKSYPPPTPLSTNVVLAVNVGGPGSSSGGKAYESNWYDFGYFFTVAMNGTWQFFAGQDILASGKVPPPGQGFHTAKVAALIDSATKTQTLTCFWDGVKLVDMKDSQWTAGFVAVGSGWHTAQFDNLALTWAFS